MIVIEVYDPNFIVERTGSFLERSNHNPERTDLERNDHGTKWPDTVIETQELSEVLSTTLIQDGLT